MREGIENEISPGKKIRDARNLPKFSEVKSKEAKEMKGTSQRAAQRNREQVTCYDLQQR